MDDQITKEITKIQEEALKAMGRDPYEVKKQVAIEHEDGDLFGDENGTFSLQKLKVEWMKNAIPEYEIPAMISKWVQLTVPEKLYFDEEEYLTKIMNLKRTPYDRQIFLNRFANIEGLCHEYFTTEISIPKLTIRVSSLPFTQINGVSFYSRNQSRIVLLNETFLYNVPELLKVIRPCLRLKKYHDVFDGARNVENNDDKVNYVVEEVSSLLDPILPIMIGMILDIMSNQNPTFQTFGITTDGVFAMQVNNLGMPPTGFETWKFDEEYFSELRENGIEAVRFGDVEYKLPTRADFLAVQGFFTLVLGHEFSHFYRNHHDKRNEGKMLRSMEQVQEAVKFLRSSQCDPRFTMTDIRSKEFFVSQPTEAEADADGLRCVLKYCADNNIEGEDFDNVIVGALSAFYFMEMMDRIHQTHEFGLAGCMDYIRTPAYYRNFVLPSEHPSPMTRVDEAIKNNGWPENMGAQKAAIVDIWQDLALSLDWQWITYAEQIEQMMQEVRIIPKSNINRERIFQNYSAVGCFDGVSPIQQS